MPYPNVKDSHTPWLGTIPEHWDVRRLKQVCSRSALYGANIPASSYVSDGVRFLRTTDIDDDGALRDNGVYVPPSLASDYMLDDGDILLSRSGTVGRAFLYDRQIHGACAYAGYLVRFVLSSQVLPRFLLYFTKSGAFASFIRVAAIQSTIDNVNGEKYGNAVVPVPPLSEQREIVRFLNNAYARIKRSITAKEQLLRLLTEQRNAIVYRAVTGGADLADGGVRTSDEWRQAIPEHWEVIATKRVLAALIDCEHKTAPEADGTDFRVVRTTGIRNGQLRMEGTYCTDAASYEAWTRRGTPEPGDVLFTREAPVGEACVVPQNVQLCLGQRTVLMKVDAARYDPQFLVHMIYCGPPRQRILVATQGSTVGHFNMDDIASMPILAPPVDEQREIIRALDSRLATIDAVRQRAQREIALIREYGERLADDATTGKIDVRDAATWLSDAPLVDSVAAETGDMAQDLGSALDGAVV